MEFTKSIRRQFKRHLEIDNAESFLRDFGNGNNANLDIDALLKNLPAFFDAVNLAYNDYDDKLRLASRSLEISSIELNTTNRKLEQLVSSMNAMMDGLGQGLLFFDRNGLCSNVFSKICLDFFEVSPEGKNIADLLGLNEQEQLELSLWLDAVFDAASAMDIADLYDMAPQSFSRNGKILRLEYRAMKDNRLKMTGVLMIATDITKEITYNTAREDLEDQAARIVTIAGNRNNFIDFIVEIEEFSNQDLLRLWDENLSTLTLRLHTYKGLASSFYLSHLAQQLHELENILAKKETISNAHRDDFLTTIKKHIMEAKDLGEKLFGEGFYQAGKIKVISQESLEKLQSMISQCDAQTKDFFEREFLEISVEESLQPFVTETKRLCAVQQKTSPRIEIEGNGVKVNPNIFKNLLGTFIHIARNIVDHGLDLPAERIRAGKSPEGKISVICQKSGGQLAITFSDDGAGIDTEKLWAAVKNRTSPVDNPWTPENILQSVFLPSISTSKETTILSGRGIGLAAVREEVEKLSGTINIASQKSQGTILTISVPV